MIEFFNSMTSMEFAFWIIAIPSTIFFTLQIASTFLIGDLDMDSDVEVDGMPFEMFTLRNLIAFLTVFSWTGIVCIEHSMSLPSTLIISMLSAITVVLMLSSLFYFMSKLAQENNIDSSSAIGKIGTVYLRIPENGIGKINVIYGGARRESPATSKYAIATGESIRVIGKEHDTLIVEPLDIQLLKSL